ncbi:MAG: class I SAM-dependent methyltransferase [Thermosphaera sp.]
MLYEEVLFKHSTGVKKWLDLGCGREFLPAWRHEQEKQLVRRPQMLVGVDYDMSSLKDNHSLCHKVRGDVSCLPFRDGQFDLVTANMVFEHLKDPQVQLKEIFRILRPGGELVFHTPSARGYGPLLAKLITERMKDRVIWYLQRRRPQDIFPTYYRINTRSDIERLAIITGFELSSLRMIVSTPLFIMIPPLLVLELLLIRFLMSDIGRPFRSNIIAVFKRPSST